MVWYVETGITPTAIPSGGGVVRSPPNLVPQNGLAHTQLCVQEIGCSQLVHTD
jgi:hypothetical protein